MRAKIWINSLAEIPEEGLGYEDICVFDVAGTEYEYKIYRTYIAPLQCAGRYGGNDRIIMQELGLDTNAFCRKHYLVRGRRYWKSAKAWPDAGNDDMKSVTAVVKAIYAVLDPRARGIQLFNSFARRQHEARI